MMSLITIEIDDFYYRSPTYRYRACRTAFILGSPKKSSFSLAGSLLSGISFFFSSFLSCDGATPLALLSLCKAKPLTEMLAGK